MTNYLAVSEEILTLTRSMLEAAQAAEWAKVQEQEVHRQTLLNKLSLSDGITDRYGEHAAANLKETIKLNNQLIDLGDQAKAELQGEIGLFQRGRKANLAYNQIK